MRDDRGRGLEEDGEVADVDRQPHLGWWARWLTGAATILLGSGIGAAFYVLVPEVTDTGSGSRFEGEVEDRPVSAVGIGHLTGEDEAVALLVRTHRQRRHRRQRLLSRQVVGALERITRFLEEASLTPCTARTLTDPVDLRTALARVREQGWSMVDCELGEGLLSASAPVRDRTGAVVAALASSTSTGRAAPRLNACRTRPSRRSWKRPPPFPPSSDTRPLDLDADRIASVRMARNRNENGLITLVDGTLAAAVTAQTNLIVELNEPVTVTRPLGRSAEASMIRFFADKPETALDALRPAAPSVA